MDLSLEKKPSQTMAQLNLLPKVGRRLKPERPIGLSVPPSEMPQDGVQFQF